MRYQKYLQPEPFRALTVLAALHELGAVAGRLPAEHDLPLDDSGTDGPVTALRSFGNITVAFLLREILQGSVNLGARLSVKQRGLELVRALFSAACRHTFPEYRTLITHRNWTDLLDTYTTALKSDALTDVQRQGEAVVEGPKAQLLKTLLGQKSVAAGDSLLRLLGPLTESSGSANAFIMRFTLHPGERLALEYLRKTGRKRAVPQNAVNEVLRHAGYLAEEADAIIELLTCRDLITRSATGVRPFAADRGERELTLKEIDTLAARVEALGGPSPVPALPEGTPSLRDLWAHLERLRGIIREVLDDLSQRLGRKRQQFRRLIGVVRAEEIPPDWGKSGLTTHLRGIAKLLERARKALSRGLDRESKRLDDELAAGQDSEEEWALAWRTREGSFERVWGELEQRVAEFRNQAKSLRAWAPLNDRLASLADLGTKLTVSDPALARSVSKLISELRERFATDNWDPVHAHEEVAVQISHLETQAQGLGFSRIRSYLAELDILRVQFNDFLSGPAPLISNPEGAGDRSGPNHMGLYDWALEGFSTSAGQLRLRRSHGQPWRHPTRKSQGWADIDGRLGRAMTSAKSSPTFAAVTRVGELLLLMRQGFLVAGADRGEVVYEGVDGATSLGGLEPLLAEGKVRVRVEWIEPSKTASKPD